jgi:hypothetical protein
VLSTIAHEEPDRVPLALWGSWFGVTDKLYFNVLDTLGWVVIIGSLLGVTFHGLGRMFSKRKKEK